MKKPKSMHSKISESDPDRLNSYIGMFDRLLLYNLAAGTMPAEIIDEMIEKWAQTIKSTIDTEAQHRTHFLESTPQGRLAKKQDQPDGEDIRLLFLETLDTAKQIVTRNLQRDEDDFDGSESEF
jgi:hypothetical protein